MFTESDVKKILRAIIARPAASSSSGPSKSQTFALPPTLELVSGGLVLECHAKSFIEKVIFSTEESSRITLLELASLANLEVKKVEALLPSNDEPFWGRIGNSTVIRKIEYVNLQEDVQRRMKDRVLIISLYCKEKTIDAQFFRKLLGASMPTSDIEWIGYDRDMVCAKTLYEDCELAIKKELGNITIPTDISTLIPERQVPLTFISVLIKNILKKGESSLGMLKGTTYTPYSFIEARRNDLVERLNHDGILDLETFRREGLTNLPGFHVLENHVVTEDYVVQLKASVEQKLEVEGWAEVKDARYLLGQADENALRLLLRNRQVDFDMHAGRLVSSTLKHSLTEQVANFAVQQAQLASKLKSKGEIRSKTLKRQDLLQFLIGSCSIPSPALTSMLDTMYPIALDSFNNVIKVVQEEGAKNISNVLWEKGYGRFQIHYAAVQAVDEVPLRSKLAADLVDYSRELLLGYLDRYETFIEPDIIPSPILDFRIALQQTANSKAKPEQLLEDINKGLQNVMRLMVDLSASDTMLEHQKHRFISDLKAQLEKTNDASLALTLTLILLHADLGPGVLRASGKYVPKLLKLLQGKIDQQMMDDLIKLKDAVVSRKKVAEDDINRLRQIGDRSVRFGS